MLRCVLTTLLMLMTAAPLWPVAAGRTAEPGLPPIKVYRMREGLPQDTILHLGLDSRGRLWAGTQEGAASYDGTQWRTYAMPEATRSNVVECVLHARDGSLWFGRRDGGIAQLKGDTWRIHGPAEGVPKGRVNSLIETVDAQGNSQIWGGVLGVGLVRWDGQRWQVLDRAGGLPGNRVWRLYLVNGRQDAFWICLEGALARWEGGRVEVVPGLPADNFNCLLETRGTGDRVVLWIGTYGDGLYRLEGGKLEHFGIPEGLPNPFVTDLAESRDALGRPILWATTLSGLGRYQEGTWSNFGAREGLPSGGAYRVVVMGGKGGPEYLWLGTSGGGLVRMTLGRWTSHDPRTGLPEGRVWMVAETRSGGVAGDLWVAGSLGLWRRHQGRWEPQPQTERIVCLLESQDALGRHELWAGGVKGLWLRRDGRWRAVGRSDGFPEVRVSSLLETRGAQGQRILWAGTESKGLMKLEGGRWSVLPDGHALPGDFITTLAEIQGPDGQRTLWIGTRSGVGVFDAQGLRPLKPKGGFPNEQITCFLPFPAKGPTTHLLVGTFGGGVFRVDLAKPEAAPASFPGGEGEGPPSGSIMDLRWDREGRLYVFTIKGVQRLSPQLAGGWSSMHFSEEDGLPSSQCSAKAAFEDSLGRLWIGTISGAACLDPGTVKVDRQPKPLYVDPMQADGRPVPEGGIAALPRGTQRVTFSYGLLSYFREAETQFQVQLVGLQAAPQSWSSQPRCEFGTLPAGSYRFRVWGRDYAGNVSGPVEVPFDILPAYWETWWFRTCLALAGALVVGLAVRGWVGVAHRRNVALEAMVHQRTEALARANDVLLAEIETRQKAQRAKDEFVAVVSHELRTPLTSIHGALGIMNSGALGTMPERLKPLVEIALRNSLRLQALVNDLLDIQKIESGALLLTQVPTSLAPLVERVVEGMAGYAQTCGVQIEVFPPSVPTWVEADGARLEQVLANLLSNACKHSQEGGKVEVRQESSNGKARVAVTNRGEPIPLAFRPHLFQKFATADASSTRAVGGTGLGLAICKAILEHSGGRIGYESADEGTTFWFELPEIEPPMGPSLSS